MHPSHTNGYLLPPFSLSPKKKKEEKKKPLTLIFLFPLLLSHPAEHIFNTSSSLQVMGYTTLYITNAFGALFQNKTKKTFFVSYDCN